MNTWWCKIPCPPPSSSPILKPPTTRSECVCTVSSVHSDIVSVKTHYYYVNNSAVPSIRSFIYTSLYRREHNLEFGQILNEKYISLDRIKDRR